jgi:hypothetical protein
LEFWKQFWKREKDFTLSVSADAYRSLLSFACAVLVHFGILALQAVGFPAIVTSLLDLADYAWLISTVFVTAYMFVAKLKTRKE